MQSIKETAANIAASAKSGLEKTKATMQEKVDRMSANDPEQKEMATHKKEERMAEAEWNKQDVREHNAAARQAASATGGQGRYTTGGSYGAGGGTDAYSTGGGIGSGTESYSHSGGQGRYTANESYGAGGGGRDAYGRSEIGSGLDTYGQPGGQGRSTAGGAYGAAGGGFDAYGSSGIGSGTETYSHSATGSPGQRMGTHQTSATYAGLMEDGVERTHPTGMQAAATGHNAHVEGTGYGTEATGTRRNVGSGYGTGGSY